MPGGSRSVSLQPGLNFRHNPSPDVFGIGIEESSPSRESYLYPAQCIAQGVRRSFPVDKCFYVLGLMVRNATQNGCVQQVPHADFFKSDFVSSRPSVYRVSSFCGMKLSPIAVWQGISRFIFRDWQHLKILVTHIGRNIREGLLVCEIYENKVPRKLELTRYVAIGAAISLATRLPKACARARGRVLLLMFLQNALPFT